MSELQEGLTEVQRKWLDVFEKQGANITAACKAANVGRSTVYKWMDEIDVFKRAVEDVRESMIDYAEASLKKQIKDGNTTATIFFLKTIGRKRGYIERQEQVNIDVTEDSYLAKLARVVDSESSAD